ncbi:MAG: FMN-binding negative transcriptional regulator [Pseudomonadota bacterium]
MHPNRIFRREETTRHLEFVRETAFGILSVNADPSPVLSHIPFLISDDGTRLEAHLVRNNPIAKMLTQGPCPAVIAVQGPFGYISPDWYGMLDQVPTWNYVAVHLRGTLRALPDDALFGVLERISDQMEARLAPKPVWKMEKMTPSVRDQMMRMIVPVEMDVAEIDGTWKLGQNKPEDARIGAADGLEEAGQGAETTRLAALMRSL